MQLHELKDESCPNCGAPTIRESCTHRHTNGQGFEERVFGCGHAIRWSPNFQRQEVVTLCPHAPEIRERNAKRKLASTKLREFLTKLDVDSEWSDAVRRELRGYLHD